MRSKSPSLLIFVSVLLTVTPSGYCRADANEEIDFDNAMLNLGGKIYVNSKRNKSIYKISQEIERAPKNASLYLKRAQNFYKEKKYDLTIEDCTKAIALDGKLAAAFEQRGAAYDAISNYEFAIQDLRKAVALDPKRRAAYFSIASINNRRRTYMPTIDCLSKYLKFVPNDTEALRLRGEAYAHLKLNKECFDDLNRAVSLNAKDGRNYQYRGRCFYKFNNAALAMKDNDIALKLLPEDSSVLIDRGMIFALRGEYESALVQFDKVIAKNPNNHQAYNEKAIVLAQLGRHQEADAAFDKAVQLDEHHRNLYYSNHAKTAARFGNVDDALADVQAMRHTSARTNSATAFDTKDVNDLIARQTKLISLKPNGDEHYYDRAVLYMCKYDWRSAVKDLDVFLVHAHGEGESVLNAVALKAVSLRMLSKENEAKDHLRLWRGKFAAPWGRALFNTMLAEAPESRLLAAAQTAGKSINAKCLMGLWLLPTRESTHARRLLQDVVHSGDRQLDEYSLAVAALQRTHQ